MTARANTSSGPKADLAPTAHDGSHPIAYAIVWGIAIGLLLLLIGLLSDTHDTYFSAIAPASSHSVLILPAIGPLTPLGFSS